MMSDRANPILVKELRQARRSRAFVVLVGLTLLACVLITLNALARNRSYGALGVGDDVFSMLYLCMSFVGFLVVPSLAHRSLAREQEEGAWELLQLTGLGPRRILAGKLASTLILGGLFVALVMPFLLLTHALGSVDLATLAGLGAYGAALSAALAVWALFTAAVPVTRAQRTGMQLAVLVSLVFALGMSFAGAESLLRHGVFLSEPSADRGDDLRTLLIAGLATAGGCAVLFEAAVSRLSLATERYARGPRLVVAAATAAVSAVGLWRWLATHDGDVIVATQVATSVLGFAAALGFAADQDRARGRGANDAAWLRPGAVAGLRYVAGQLALPTALWLGIALSHGGDQAAAVVAAPSYVLIFMSVTLLLCRGLGRFERLAAPDIVRATALVLVLFMGILPAALAGMPSVSERVWAALPSPFIGTIGLTGALTHQRTAAAGVLFAAALVVTTLADRLLVARARRSRA